jgi:hypothetical protein
MTLRPLRLSLVIGAFVATMAMPTAAHAAKVMAAPAPFFWDDQAHVRIGGDADRFELGDSSHAASMSAWYHLSYVAGSDRIEVHDHSSISTRGIESAIAKSENVAWHVASVLLGGAGGAARAAEMPAWARPRTGGADGTSAGLVFTLADVDLLTPGRLVGDLRVAGTGTVGSDGVVTAVRGVDAKLAAARLAAADVMFSPDFPPGTGAVSEVTSHVGHDDPDRRIGDWLNTAAYEHAGRLAAADAGSLALVRVDDVRQALAWLCGRTESHVVCDVAHAASRATVRQARPYNQRWSTESAPSTSSSTSAM